MGSECVKSKLCACSLGLALGTIKGFYLLLLAYSAMFFGFGAEMVNHISSMYHGYDASIVGGLLGFVYGVVGGFIFGFIMGFVYNFYLCKCSKHCSKSE